MNITQKLIAIIILTITLFTIIIPTAIAVSENVIESNTTKEEKTQDYDDTNQTLVSQENDISTQNTTTHNNEVSKETDVNDVIQENVTENNIINDIENNNTEESTITKTNIFDDRVSNKIFGLLLKDNIFKTTHSNSDLPKKGIWISNDSREFFLKFINKYTIYTYSINEDGFLIHDNVKKENTNLDDIEKNETPIDIEINSILSKDMLISIKIDNGYSVYNENNEKIERQNFVSNEFVKTFSNETDNERVIILNSSYYNTDIYKLSLEDYFVKSLQNTPKKILDGTLKLSKENANIRSATNNIGYSTINQTVYAGPDSKNYAEVGSISANEKIYVLGKSFGWYHIQYKVTGTGKEKSGMVPIENIKNLTITNVHEENMTGGLRYTNHEISVQSCDDFQISTSLGSIYEGEGVTLLYDYGYTNSAGNSYRVAYVEFSSPVGTKRGYMYADQLNSPTYLTTVARVVTTSDIIAGPTDAYAVLGAVAYKEFVSIIGKIDNVIFVEYNTNDGRKRGYMSFGNVVPYKEGVYYQDFYYPSTNIKEANGNYNIYGGPNTNYAVLGSVSYENVFYLSEENEFTYIEFSTSLGAKRGYIQSNYLSDFNLTMNIPEPSAYSNVEKIYFGSTGFAKETYNKDGKPLYAYKIGTGQNVLFDVFAQHGFEDNWNQDGIELVKIANNLINQLATDNEANILDNWTIYIIPVFNADGLIYGFYKDGPGRHTMTSLDGTGVDMNRSWPTGFVIQPAGRYRTGNSPLLAYEALDLRDFLLANKSQARQTVLIDSHGWYNQTVGDSGLGKYYWDANTLNLPSSSHSYSYGSGYLINWARTELGNSNYAARSVLVEFPNAANANVVTNDNYSGKYIQATKNLLKNEWK